jgi:hypothetical protein
MNEASDLQLREAIREEAYRAPVHLTFAVLRDRVDGDAARRRARRPWQVALAATAGLALVVSVVAFLPLFQQLAGPADTRSTPTEPCAESTGTKHGRWWVEIGGPGAFFNIEPDSLQATEPGARWLVITRFHPDPGSVATVAIWAERAGSGDRVDGSFNSPMDPGSIYRLDEPAPALPGGWYLFEQEIPSTGCWQLTAAIDGRVVGSATIDVTVARQPSTPDPVAPTPAIAEDQRPALSVRIRS